MNHSLKAPQPFVDGRFQEARCRESQKYLFSCCNLSCVLPTTTRHTHPHQVWDFTMRRVMINCPKGQCETLQTHDCIPPVTCWSFVEVMVSEMAHWSVNFQGNVWWDLYNVLNDSGGSRMKLSSLSFQESSLTPEFWRCKLKWYPVWWEVSMTTRPAYRPGCLVWDTAI